MRFRVLAVAAFAVLASVPLPHDVQAADATLRVEKQGWYWRPAQRVNAESPVCPPPSVAPCPATQQQPSAIEPDHFAVSFSGGQPAQSRDQAYAVFQFDLTWMDPGTEVSQALLVLEESNDDATHRNRRPSGVYGSSAAGTKLRACLIRDFWGGSQPGLWSEVPPIDCNAAQAAGQRRDVELDGRLIPVWTFDITPLARVWGRDPLANYGLAIVSDAAASGEFQVAFHGDTRIVNVDPVTRLEETIQVLRVVASMRFRPPPSTDDGLGTLSGFDFGSPSSVSPLIGTPEVSLGADAPITADASVPEVNRSVRLRRAVPSLFAGSATAPAYMWVGLPIGIVLARLFWLLFGAGGAVSENRVAAAYRKRRLGV